MNINQNIFVFSFFFITVLLLLFFEINILICIFTLCIFFFFLYIFQLNISKNKIALSAILFAIGVYIINYYIYSPVQITQPVSISQESAKYIERISKYKILIKHKTYGKLIAYKYSSASLKKNTELNISGEVHPCTSKKKYYCKRKRITGYIKKYTQHNITNNPLHNTKSLKNIFTNIHKKHLDHRQYTLVSKILLGRASPEKIDSNLQKLSQHLGLSHIFSASGLHLGIISAWVYLISSLFTRKRVFIISLVLITGTFYCSLGEWSPSLIRAYILLITGLIALQLQSVPKLINILLLSLIIQLIINCYSIADIGLQFSYLATIGIIYYLPILYNKIRSLPLWLNLLYLVPVTAQILTLPLSLYYFGNVSLYSILANILLVPIASIILGLSFIVSIVSLFAGFGEYVASLLQNINSLLINFFFDYIFLFESLPLYNLHLENFSIYLCLFIYLLIIICTFYSLVKNKYKNYLPVILISLGIFSVFLPVALNYNILSWQYLPAKNNNSLLFTFNTFKQTNILICNTQDSGINNSLEYNLLKNNTKIIHYKLGNCQLTDKIKIFNNINITDKIQKLKIKNKLTLEYNSQAIFLRYKNLKLLILFTPVTNNQEYNFIYYFYNNPQKKNILWSELPKSQYCILPVLTGKKSKFITELISKNCKNIKKYKNLNIIKTDGNSI